MSPGMSPGGNYGGSVLPDPPTAYLPYQYWFGKSDAILSKVKVEFFSQVFISVKGSSLEITVCLQIPSPPPPP